MAVRRLRAHQFSAPIKISAPRNAGARIDTVTETLPLRKGSRRGSAAAKDSRRRCAKSDA